MAFYYVNGMFKSLPPNPKSTVGLTKFSKTLKRELDELNVAYADLCCLEGLTTFPVRANTAGDNTLEYFNGTEWAAFPFDVSLVDVVITGGITNGTQIAAFYPQIAQDNITAGTGGAIAVTNYLTTINTDAGGDAFTLANGTVKGQMKKILLVVDGGGDGVVTPATAFAGGTAATFNDAGDFLILQWSGTAWIVIENNGVVIA